MNDNDVCNHCGKEVKTGWRLCPWCGWDVIREKDYVSGITLITGERKKIRNAAGTIAGFKSVNSVFLVSGEADIAVKVTAPTFEELRSFVVDSIGGVDGVVDTRTYMVVSSLKEENKNPPDPGTDPVRTIILLKVDQAKKENLGDALIHYKNVEDVLQVTGDADLVLKCLFPNYSDMKTFISDRIGNLPGIKEQKTFMAMAIFKEYGKATSEVPKAKAMPDDVYFKLPENETDVMNVLTNLPRGVPSSLWGFEIDELAQKILEAEYGITSRGAPVVKLKDKWYRADIEDKSTYLQAYDGDVLKK